jgi:hypothetical protein
MFLAARRREIEMHSQLALHALGSSGDGEAVKKQMDKWEKDQ